MTKKKRPGTGFAAMDPARVRELAGMGGRQAHLDGRAHKFTSEEAREAGRKSAQSRWSKSGDFRG